MEAIRILEQMRGVQMLRHLGDEQLDDLGRSMTRVDLGTGDVLFHQGLPGGAMALLVTGRLVVRARGIDHDAVVGHIYPGEIVGEMACIDRAPRAASVLAEEPSVVFCLTNERFQFLEGTMPALAIAIRRSILSQLARRLRETNRRVDGELQRRGIPPIAPAPLPEERRPGGSGPTRLDLRRVPFLKDFQDNELAALVAMAPPMTYPEGHKLCIDGEPGRCAFVLARGVVSVTRRIDREDRHLATLTDGAVFGHMALIDDEPRSATVVVAEPSVILKIDQGPFQALLDDFSPFAMRFQHQIAVAGVRQLRDATDSLASLMTSDPDHVEPARPGALPDMSKPREASAAQPTSALPTPGPAKAASVRKSSRQKVLDRNTRKLMFLRAATNEWGLALDGFKNDDDIPG